MTNVSVVIPCYNESKNIPKLLRTIETLVKCCDKVTEILVVQNGSTDKSAELLSEHVEKSTFRNQIKVLNLESNLGYGGGCKIGISRAVNQVICLIPADGKYPDKDILNVLYWYGQINDPMTLVKGARYSRNDPLLIQLLSSALSKIVRVFFNTKAIDVNGLPKVFDRSIIIDQLHLCHEEAAFDSTIVALWSFRKGMVNEIPVSFFLDPDGVPSWSRRITMTSFRMFFSITAFRLKLRRLMS